MTWQSKLIRWYRKHRRDLPWRRRPTPYRVLISEIMLQQTTVKTVIPYYQRFLKRFPSLRSLAESKEQEVLAAWSGLGYYSRARNLRRSAEICVQKFGGRVPRDVETLRSLPGIGAYTAGAIASIANEQKAAIVDGNVARVLSRLFCIAADPKAAADQKRFWQKAEQSLPRQHFGDYNQGLMELGATVCTPTVPNCHLCPLQSDCAAYERDQVGRFPKRSKKISYRSVQLTAALIARGRSFLMQQRPAHGILAKMWEFPLIEGDLDELGQSLSFPLAGARRLRSVRHSIMDQRITVTPWLFELNGQKAPKPPQSRWIPCWDLSSLPSSSMVHKLAALIG